MNFIIEILPKKDKVNEYVFVVRSQNGFPIAVCYSLDDAKVVIQEKLDEVDKSHSNA